MTERELVEIKSFVVDAMTVINWLVRYAPPRWPSDVAAALNGCKTSAAVLGRRDGEYTGGAKP